MIYDRITLNFYPSRRHVFSQNFHRFFFWFVCFERHYDIVFRCYLSTKDFGAATRTTWKRWRILLTGKYILVVLFIYCYICYILEMSLLNKVPWVPWVPNCSTCPKSLIALSVQVPEYPKCPSAWVFSECLSIWLPS